MLSVEYNYFNFKAKWLIDLENIFSVYRPDHCQGILKYMCLDAS